MWKYSYTALLFTLLHLWLYIALMIAAEANDSERILVGGLILGFPLMYILPPLFGFLVPDAQEPTLNFFFLLSLSLNSILWGISLTCLYSWIAYAGRSIVWAVRRQKPP